MAPHSSILAWKIPWTEEPGGLQSMGSQRVGHDSSDSMHGVPQGKVLPQCHKQVSGGGGLDPRGPSP